MLYLVRRDGLPVRCRRTASPKPSDYEFKAIRTERDKAKVDVRRLECPKIDAFENAPHFFTSEASNADVQRAEGT